MTELNCKFSLFELYFNYKSSSYLSSSYLSSSYLSSSYLSSSGLGVVQRIFTRNCLMCWHFSVS